MYEFVTDYNLEDPDDFLACKFEQISTQKQSAEEEHKDNIFKEMYIPRTVQELSLEDIYRMQREGATEELEKFAKLTNFQSTKE